MYRYLCSGVVPVAGAGILRSLLAFLGCGATRSSRTRGGVVRDRSTGLAGSSPPTHSAICSSSARAVLTVIGLLIVGCSPSPKSTEVVVAGRFSNAGGPVWMGVVIGEEDGWPRSSSVPLCASPSPECALRVPSDVGRIIVVGRSKDRAPARRLVDVELARLQGQQEISVDLPLAPGESTIGVVLNADGIPLSAAEIQADLVGGVPDSIPEEAKRNTAQSGENGRFVLRGMEPGGYKIVAKLPGYLAVDRRWNVPAARRDLRIVMDRAGFVDGLVLDDDGEPMPGVRAVAGAIHGVTDDAGRFRLGPFRSGTRVAVEAVANGIGRSGDKPVVVPASDIVLRIARVGEIRGFVFDAATQTPVESFCVFSERGRRDANGHVLRSPDGTFQLAGRRGSYRIGVAVQGFVPLRLDDIYVARQPARELKFAMERARGINGWIVDEASGDAIAGAWVSMAGFKWVLEHCGQPRALSGADGSFSLSGVPYGAFPIEAGAYGYVSRRINTTGVDPMSVRLSKGASVFGALLVPDGLSAGRATIKLKGDATRSTITDGDGRFEFHGLRHGQYRVEARVAHWPTVERDLFLTETVRDFKIELDRLTSSGSVAGTVSGLGDCRITRVEFGRLGWTNIDSGGRYKLNGLPPGQAGVVARGLACGPSDWRLSGRKKVPIRPDETTTVDFTFGGRARLFGRVTRNGVGAVIHVSTTQLFDNTDSEMVDGFVMTSPDGHYEIPHLNNGRHLVNIGTTMTMDIHGDTRFDVDLCEDSSLRPLVKDTDNRRAACDNLSVSGRVATSGGRGVPGAWVMITGEHRRSWTSTDGVGAFAFRDLRLGPYAVGVYKFGYDLAAHRVSLQTSMDAMTITLNPATSGENVVVRDQGGSPIPGGVVVDIEGNFLAPTYLAVDSDGNATMPTSLAGHDLTFHRLGYRPARVPDWDGGPLVVDLIPCDSGRDCSQMSELLSHGKAGD